MPLWRNGKRDGLKIHYPLNGLSVRIRPKARPDRADSRELKTECYGKVKSNAGQRNVPLEQCKSQEPPNRGLCHAGNCRVPWSKLGTDVPRIGRIRVETRNRDGLPGNVLYRVNGKPFNVHCAGLPD